MKVHDIISEANPISALKTGVAAYKAARASAPVVAKATTKAAAKGVSTASKAAKPVAQAADDLGWWGNMAVKIADKIKGN